MDLDKDFKHHPAELPVQHSQTCKSVLPTSARLHTCLHIFKLSALFPFSGGAAKLLRARQSCAQTRVTHQNTRNSCRTGGHEADLAWHFGILGAPLVPRTELTLPQKRLQLMLQLVTASEWSFPSLLTTR